MNACDDGGRPLLVLAADDARRNRVSELLLSHDNVDVNACDQSGRTALHLASMRDNVHLATLLLARPEIDVNRAKRDKTTPLHLSTANDNSVAVATLLLARPEIAVNVADFQKRTPLSIAVSRGNTEFVKLLLARAETDVNKPDRDGNTPLMSAALNNCTELCDMLLSHPCIDVNALTRSNWNALHMAACRAGSQIFTALVTCGADWRQITNRGESVFTVAKANKAGGWNAPRETVSIVRKYERRRLAELAIGLMALDWPVLMVLEVASWLNIGGKVDSIEYGPNSIQMWEICKIVKQGSHQKVVREGQNGQ